MGFPLSRSIYSHFRCRLFFTFRSSLVLLYDHRCRLLSTVVSIALVCLHSEFVFFFFSFVFLYLLRLFWFLLVERPSSAKYLPRYILLRPSAYSSFPNLSCVGASGSLAPHPSIVTASAT
ncbi:hypothetical protein BJ508DRAFT_14654 [Ascobolus immersus RN42]|uniref:Uncharacterized protein n=1 Tax=Ascobolus immersus RN42 TaxID=1160509 RepID=A0A3N4HQ28_ASCIM|nr:hypothetical protein BJ508DRAFT_14654 [Ascobolus immersus RN42]